MSLPKLYEIVEQFKGLELLAQTEDLPAELIRDTLEGLQGDMQLKATNVAKFILGLEAEADAMHEAAEAIRQRGERRKRRAESIRAYLLLNMQTAGVTKVECPEFTMSVRKNPEAVQIMDPLNVPAEFMVQPEPPPPRPDKTAIKAALKEGREVDGCWLTQSERLEIRS
jgi:hypothetical protein